jgi:CpXC protein
MLPAAQKAARAMSLDVEHLHRSTEWPFACDCGCEFTSTIYHAVNITLQPQLLYTLLAGKLNVAACPNCGRTVASPLPFVYHDMQRGLFAYVHPSASLDEEEREHLLEQLRMVYADAVEESAHLRPQSSSRPRRSSPSRPRDTAGLPPAVIEPDAPPMQVIFGVDRLVSLVDSLLEPAERLGRVALTTHSQSASERGRLLMVARQMAEQLDCQIETDERAGTYTVGIFGPRSQISKLMNILHSAS